MIDGSDRTDELPNRDAADFRLDEANLFLNNRFQGRDFILQALILPLVCPALPTTLLSVILPALQACPIRLRAKHLPA